MIEMVAKHTTKDTDQQSDLIQDLVLKCYDNEITVKRLHKSNRLNRWLYTVALNIKRDEHRKAKPVKLDFDVIESEFKHRYERIKTHAEVMSVLNHKEQTWIGVYMFHGFNVNKMHKATGLSRITIDERLKTIFKKWKQLDIYLPQ